MPLSKTVSRLAIAALLPSCLVLNASADTFVPSCTRIGPTDGSITNNEFSPKGKFATWAETYGYSQGYGDFTQDYWIAGVDSNGDLTPPDGRYFFLTAGVQWGVFAYWGYNANSSTVYTSDVQKQIHRITVNEDLGTIVDDTITGPLDRMPQYIYPSRISDADTDYLVYLKSFKFFGRTYFDVFWMDTSVPDVEHRVTINGRAYFFPQKFFSNPRWVPERKLVVFPYFDDQTGFIQVGALHLDTGATAILTTDDGDKVDPFPFVAEEYPDEWLMLAVVDENKIAVYRKNALGQGMTRIKTVDIPSDFQYEQSAETFSWEGKTYISTGVNQDPPKSRLTPNPDKTRLSELWIADIDPNSDFTRKVSDDVVTFALDPETVKTETGVWFTGYMRPDGSALHELHKCRTGFGN